MVKLGRPSPLDGLTPSQREAVLKAKRDEHNAKQREKTRIAREARNAERAKLEARDEHRQAKSPGPPKVVDLDEMMGRGGIDDNVKSSKDKRIVYLAFLEKGVKRTNAAARTGVAYNTVKYWRKTDPEFAREEAEIEETFLDNVEDVVRQLAQTNDLRAALAILERKRPEVWAPRKEVHVAHTLQFSGSLEDRMNRIAQLMDAAKQPALEPMIWDADVVYEPTLPAALPAGAAESALDTESAAGNEAGITR